MISRIDITETLAVLTGNASDKTPNAHEITIQAWCDYFDGHPNWTGDDLATAAHEYCKRPRERLVQPADLGEIVKTIRRDRYERADPDTRDNPWRELGGQPSRSVIPLPDGGFIDANGVRRDRHGYVDKSAPDDDEYPDDATTEQRLAVHWAKVTALRDSQEHHQAVDHFGALAKTPSASDDARNAAMTEIRKILAARGDKTPRPFAYLDNSPTNPLVVTCPHCGADPGRKCHIPGTLDVLALSRAHPSRFEAAEKAAANA